MLHLRGPPTAGTTPPNMQRRLPSSRVATTPPTRPGGPPTPARQPAPQTSDRLRMPRLRHQTARNPDLPNLQHLHAPPRLRRNLPMLRRTHHPRRTPQPLTPDHDTRATGPGTGAKIHEDSGAKSLDDTHTCVTSDWPTPFTGRRSAP